MCYSCDLSYNVIVNKLVSRSHWLHTETEWQTGQEMNDHHDKNIMSEYDTYIYML